MSGWQNEPFALDVKAGDTKAFCSFGLPKTDLIVMVLTKLNLVLGLSHR